MDIELYKKQLTETLIEPLLEFHSDEDNFKDLKKDILKCEKLLLKYLDGLGKLKKPTNKSILKLVKKVVLALNALNEKNELIETEERDTICVLIEGAAVASGLENPADDITEEWRDW